MNQKSENTVKHLCASLAALFFICALYFSCRDYSERGTIREKAEEIVRGKQTETEKITAAAQWVSSAVKFVGKNEHIETRPILRDTYTDILKNGGQCGEKVRVMVLLCDSLSIYARRFYTFPENNMLSLKNRSSHVVVKTADFIIDPQYLFIVKQFPADTGEITFAAALNENDAAAVNGFFDDYGAGINYTASRLMTLVYRIFRLFLDERGVRELVLPVFFERPFFMKAFLAGFFSIVFSGIYCIMRRTF